MRAGTSAFQNMLNIPSSEDETKLLESDLKKDAGILSNAFSHASCNRVDIEHEMTVTIAAGILKKAFRLFTYSAVGTSLVNGSNKKAADKEWVAEDFVKNELLRDMTCPMYNKNKKKRKNYVLAHNGYREFLN